MKFKDFLLEENKVYFGQKVSDVLSAIQDLNSSLETMGAKHLVSNAENIVNQIRRIIHTNWSEKQQEDLRILQKCAVAIMKGIEEKDDLSMILKACQEQLEAISGDSKTPVNDISIDQ
jgi:ATP phosphoribosyltransferase